MRIAQKERNLEKERERIKLLKEIEEKQKVLEVPDLNEAASTLNEITKFGFYEDLNDKDTLQ